MGKAEILITLLCVLVDIFMKPVMNRVSKVPVQSIPRTNSL